MGRTRRAIFLTMQQLLANSKGQPLVEHLKAVGNVSRFLARNRLGVDERICELAYRAGVTHDIGKATLDFQEMLRTCRMKKPPKRVREALDETSTPAEQERHEALIGSPRHEGPYHNEIGYVALLELCPSVTEEVRDAVLWHHACRQSWERLDVSADDLTQIHEVLVAVGMRPVSLTESKVQDVQDRQVIPGSRFFPFRKERGVISDTVALREMIVRACLIAADRLVSKYADVDECIALASGVDPREVLGSILDVDLYDVPQLAEVKELLGQLSQRDLDQLSCAEAQHGERSNILQVNAPTGMGKTRIGLYRMIARQRRTIWVCPRNAVADAVFQNIKDEIQTLEKQGIKLNVSFELFYAGDRQAASEDNQTESFGSDIVVTNIDMLLQPQMAFIHHERLFRMFSDDIVFDEFHEFAMPGSALLAMVRRLIRARCLATSASTMCLSATPSSILDDMNPQYLPAQGQHFKAATEKPVRLVLHDNAVVLGIPVKKGCLTIVNAIKNSCDLLLQNEGTEILAHSQFTRRDKEGRLRLIRDLFGPDSDLERRRKEAVVSALILRAGVNISFEEAHISSSGPEADMQAARTNRFGEYDEAVIELYRCPDDRREMDAIRASGNTDVRDVWFGFLLARFGADSVLPNLNTLYTAYNDFYQDHGGLVRSVHTKWEQEGAEKIKKLAPERPGVAKSRTHETIGNANFRNPDGGGYFVTMRYGNGPRKGQWLSVEDHISITEEEKERLKRGQCLDDNPSAKAREEVARIIHEGCGNLRHFNQRYSTRRGATKSSLYWSRYKDAPWIAESMLYYVETGYEI